MVALLYFSFRCIVTINVPWLFLMVPGVCVQCVMWYFLIILNYSFT